MSTETKEAPATRKAGCASCRSEFPVSDTLWKKREWGWFQGRLVVEVSNCPECGEVGLLQEDGSPLVDPPETIRCRCHNCAEIFTVPADSSILRDKPFLCHMYGQYAHGHFCPECGSVAFVPTSGRLCHRLNNAPPMNGGAYLRRVRRAMQEDGYRSALRYDTRLYSLSHSFYVGTAIYDFRWKSLSGRVRRALRLLPMVRSIADLLEKIDVSAGVPRDARGRFASLTDHEAALLREQGSRHEPVMARALRSFLIVNGLSLSDYLEDQEPRGVSEVVDSPALRAVDEAIQDPGYDHKDRREQVGVTWTGSIITLAALED